MVARRVCRGTRGIWRYNYTSEYILTHIRRTASDPDLRTYRPNSTECVGASGAVAPGAVASVDAASGGGPPGSEPRPGVAAVLAETTLAVMSAGWVHALGCWV